MEEAAIQDQPSAATGELLSTPVSPSQGNIMEPGKDVYEAAATGDAAALMEALSTGSPHSTYLDEGGHTALLIAANNGHLGCVAALIAAGADLEAKNKALEMTALHLAAAKAHVHVAETLLDNGAEIDSRNRNMWTPLHACSRNGHPAMIEFLVARGASKEAINSTESTPLLLAAGNGNKECMEALLLRGAALEPRDRDLMTPLHWATKNGKEECVRFLLEQGANHELENRDGKRPVDLAKTDAVRSLLDNAPRGGYTALQLAAYYGETDRCQEMLEAGADPLTGASAASAAAPAAARFTTPLHLAALNNHLQAARLLLQANPAAAGVRDDSGRLPVDRSAERRKSSSDLIGALVAAHPLGLHAAVEREELADLVHSLVQREPSLAYAAKDPKGRPAINLATGRCRTRMLEALFFLGRYELLNRENPKHRSASCVVLFARDFGDASVTGGRGGRKGAGAASASASAAGTAVDSGREVALKLMRNRDQFERELRLRQGATASSSSSGAAPPAATAAAEALDDRFVLPVIRTHELDNERAFVGTDGTRYPYVLVMERAEEDLAGAIAHARMTVAGARDVARALGRCLAHLHDRGLVHGDLKPLNAVRTLLSGAISEHHPPPAGGAASDPAAGSEHQWKLIDLDAASPLRTGFLGMKSSTLYSPPELLYREPTGAGAKDDAAGSAAGSGGGAAGGGAVYRDDGSVLSIPGGGGWRVRAVDEGGLSLDPSRRWSFEPLCADVSFDLWSFGVVLYELVMRETLWHGDTDSNIALETDYALLATWPDELKRSRLARVPNRWAQALLSRLLMRDPAARPPSVRAALRHPFFDEQRAHAAPPLAPSGQTGSSSPQHHFFLSHFQGNGGPRAMAIKFAVLNAVPDARIWFDQDESNKTEAGMIQGVEQSSFFALLLTRCVFSRWFCQREIAAALRCKKPIVLVRETDPRHGASQRLPEGSVSVRCAHAGCGQGAVFAPPGHAWPCKCEAHTDPSESWTPCGLSADISADLLNFSLVYEELCDKRFVVDPTALELGSQVLSGGHPSVNWFSEMEFRDVSLAKLLSAVGMEAKGARAPAAAAAAAEADGGSTAAGGCDEPAEALRRTLAGLACGCPAPALPAGARSHLCIIHDGGASAEAVKSIAKATEAAFPGALVVAPPPREAELAEAVAGASRVLVFLTRGLLAPGSPCLGAVAAALASPAAAAFARAGSAPVILAHETSAEHGGAASFGDYVAEARRAAEDGGADVTQLFSQATSIPWLRDPDFVPVCGLRLVLEGIMDEPPQGSGAERGPAGQPAGAPAAAAAAAVAAAAGPGDRPAAGWAEAPGGAASAQGEAQADDVSAEPMDERLRAALVEASALRERVRRLEAEASLRAALSSFGLGGGGRGVLEEGTAAPSAGQSAPADDGLSALLLGLLRAAADDGDFGVPAEEAAGEEAAAATTTPVADSPAPGGEAAAGAPAAFGSPFGDVHAKADAADIPSGEEPAAAAEEEGGGGFRGFAVSVPGDHLEDQNEDGEGWRPQTSSPMKTRPNREKMKASLRAMCYS